ncbi:MAG: hypothetical protein FJW20_25675 [Acidimicrobiia bacterium]|nr:hypothetical protein [Acidimicrobiia bacterium]
MRTLLLLLPLLSVSVFAEYKIEPAGPPPTEVAPAISALLSKTGHKILTTSGQLYCEIWFVAQPPAGHTSSEVDLMWKTAPPGSVIGALKFHAEGHDRRGQIIKPGVYTLRFSMFPINGDHQGVAPNRDFLVIIPAAGDQDPKPVPVFDALMKMSRPASGTPHPAVLSMWIVESDFQPGLSQLGESDWVINHPLGNIKLALIIIGKTDL